MAATITSAWGKPGAWALDSEEHEDELNKQQQENPTPTYAKSTTTTAAMSDFPDLMTAAATKTKKKKGQTISLSEFVTSKPNNSYQANKGLTAEEMLNLPTGPKQRSAEEMDRARSNGFRSYDRNDRSDGARWGPGRANDEDGGKRGPPREPLGPSRADETDDWAAAKKPGGGFGRRDGGGGGFFDGERGSGNHSRADEVDSWASNKKVVEVRRGNGGGGFDRGERRTGFESSGAADSAETWARKKDVEVRRGGAFDSLRDRRGGNDLSDSDNWGRKREEVSSGGGGGGSLSRPKLNLQPRKLPVGEVETVKPSKGSNPFGDARPREEVLKEKGEDWKEIDEKLEATKIKDLGSGDRFKRGGGKPRSNEDLTERSWRKNQAEAVDVPPPSGENSENGQHTEEPEEEEKEDAQK